MSCGAQNVLVLQSSLINLYTAAGPRLGRGGDSAVGNGCYGLRGLFLFAGALEERSRPYILAIGGKVFAWWGGT